MPGTIEPFLVLRTMRCGSSAQRCTVQCIRAWVAVAGKVVAIVFALSVGVASAAPPAGEIEIKATREGEEMTLTATVHAPVNPRVAWAVLTDFDRMPGWVPNLQESRIVS